MPADEALHRAELTIGSDLCWRRTANHVVIHIDRVSYSLLSLIQLSLSPLSKICVSQIPQSATRNEIMQLCGPKTQSNPMHE